MIINNSYKINEVKSVSIGDGARIYRRGDNYYINKGGSRKEISSDQYWKLYNNRNQDSNNDSETTVTSSAESKTATKSGETTPKIKNANKVLYANDPLIYTGKGSDGITKGEEYMITTSNEKYMNKEKSCVDASIFKKAKTLQNFFGDDDEGKYSEHVIHEATGIPEDKDILIYDKDTMGSNYRIKDLFNSGNIEEYTYNHPYDNDKEIWEKSTLDNGAVIYKNNFEGSDEYFIEKDKVKNKPIETFNRILSDGYEDVHDTISFDLQERGVITNMRNDHQSVGGRASLITNDGKCYRMEFENVRSDGWQKIYIAPDKIDNYRSRTDFPSRGLKKLWVLHELKDNTTVEDLSKTCADAIENYLNNLE